MTQGQQIRWWAAGFAIFVLALWLLSGALLPFVLGAAIAYLTDPLADRLERMGLSRTIATVLVTVAALALALLALLLILPVLIGQVQNAIAAAPGYAERLRDLASAWLPSLADPGSPVHGALEALRERAQGWSLTVLKGLWSGGLALIDFVSLVVITPVVAFYLLLDWDRMVTWIDDCLPREHIDTIRGLMRELDRVLAGFVRGQLSVCAILGAFYAVSLTLIGLEFGVLIGAFAGFVSFIPFVGSILGGALAIGIAVAQFWGNPALIGAVAAVFVCGQMAEGHILTPKFIGSKVGLHPVWLIFALSAFGSLFGSVGLLVAVPAAAGIGVFGRFALGRYKGGRLYRGRDASGPEDIAR